MGTPGQRATYETLHTANLAVSGLRGGLTSSSAVKAAPALRRLLGTPAIAIADRRNLLVYEGSDRHAEELARRLQDVVGSGRSQLLSAPDLLCDHADDCPVQAGVAVPIVVDGSVVGAFAALAPSAEAGLLRAAGEVARFVSTHLALAELDALRTRTVQAQLNFLRAQISPHFIYNALTAIESYIRSDPERARERRSAAPPGIVFVTAHEEYAVRAFEVRASDYLLKPVSRARLGVALDHALGFARDEPEVPAQEEDSLPVIPVETTGRIRLVDRLHVCWVEAEGDYARLHTIDGSSHLVRIPISHLEEKWSAHGFIRIHRSHLVPVRHITEFAAVGGNHTVVVAGQVLPVSRRHAREVRDRFLHAASRS